MARIGFRTWSGRIAADRLNALPAALLETMFYLQDSKPQLSCQCARLSEFADLFDQRSNISRELVDLSQEGNEFPKPPSSSAAITSAKPSHWLLRPAAPPVIEMAGFCPCLPCLFPVDRNGRFCQPQIPAYRFGIDHLLARNSSLRSSTTVQAVNRCLKDFDELSRVAGLMELF